MAKEPESASPTCGACPLPRETCFPFPCKNHHARLRVLASSLAASLGELLPHAVAAIGLPESPMATDPKISKARQALMVARDMGYFHEDQFSP